jgi:hypothetical protein
MGKPATLAGGGGGPRSTWVKIFSKIGWPRERLIFALYIVREKKRLHILPFILPQLINSLPNHQATRFCLIPN